MLKEYIKKVSEHHDLTTEEMKTAMNIIMDGRASSEQVSAFLIAMKMKKESPAEIAAASRVMVSKATPLPTDVKGIVDIVGTGGDCLNTFNISTTSSFDWQLPSMETAAYRVKAEVRIPWRHCMSTSPFRQRKQPICWRRLASPFCLPRPIMKACGMSARSADSLD